MNVLGEKIKSIVRERDFFAKGVCLLLAVILWAFIVSGKTEKLRYKVPIAAKNLPANLAVTDLSGKYAVIQLEGRKDELKSVNVKNIKVTVNMEKALVGEEKAYPVQVEKLQVPEDVAISLVDRDVNLNVEKKEEKWIKVLPNIVGSVPKGKIVIDKVVVPDHVRISGPKSAVNDIDDIETEEVSIENEARDFQRQVGLKNDRHKDITFGEKAFLVKVLITDVKDLVMVTVTAVVRNGMKDYDYELKERDIEVYVRANNNRPVAPGDFEAFVDASKVNAKALFDDEGKESVTKELPVVIVGKKINMADIISIMPKKVTVKIIRRQNM